MATLDTVISKLAQYEAIAKTKTVDELRFAIADIKETWKVNPDFADVETDYGQKLWAEWDAYTVELQKREK